MTLIVVIGGVNLNLTLTRVVFESKRMNMHGKYLI